MFELLAPRLNNEISFLWQTEVLQNSIYRCLLFRLQYKCLLFRPQSIKVFSSDHKVMTYNPAFVSDPNVLVDTLVAHTDAVWGLAIHSSKNQLLSCSADGTVRLWSPHSKSPLLNTFRVDDGKYIKCLMLHIFSRWTPKSSDRIILDFSVFSCHIHSRFISEAISTIHILVLRINMVY